MQDKVIRDVDDTLIADAELRTSWAIGDFAKSVCNGFMSSKLYGFVYMIFQFAFFSTTLYMCMLYLFTELFKENLGQRA
jgi:hypothetical protein